MNIQQILKAVSHVIDTSLIKAVLEGTKAVDDNDEYGRTALHHAVQSKNLVLLDTILEKGAEVDTVTTERYTALHLAVEYADPSMVLALLEYKADINAKTREEESTPLDLAIVSNNKKIAEILLDEKANINSTNAEGETALYRAIASSNHTMVEFLLSRGAKVNVRNNEGETVLYRALLGWRNVEWIHNESLIIQSLLRYGAYSYSDTKADKKLQFIWVSSVKKAKGCQSFYTYLLLAGVSVPAETILPLQLQTIQRHIEVTISTLLAPLGLSPETCALLTPEVLRALPLIGLVADPAQVSYNLPSEVAAYLIDCRGQQSEDYAAFHRELFEYKHWLTEPYAPRKLPKVYPVKATISPQLSLR